MFVFRTTHAAKMKIGYKLGTPTAYDVFFNRIYIYIWKFLLSWTQFEGRANLTRAPDYTQNKTQPCSAILDRTHRQDRNYSVELTNDVSLFFPVGTMVFSIYLHGMVLDSMAVRNFIVPAR